MPSGGAAATGSSRGGPVDGVDFIGLPAKAQRHADRHHKDDQRKAETEIFRLQLQRHSCAKLRRSEEHTSELQSLMRISYAVFCLKKKNTKTQKRNIYHNSS